MNRVRSATGAWTTTDATPDPLHPRRTDRLGEIAGKHRVWVRTQVGRWVPAKPTSAHKVPADVISVGGGPAGSVGHTHIVVRLCIDGEVVITTVPAAQHWHLVPEEGA